MHVHWNFSRSISLYMPLLQNNFLTNKGSILGTERSKLIQHENTKLLQPYHIQLLSLGHFEILYWWCWYRFYIERWICHQPFFDFRASFLYQMTTAFAKDWITGNAFITNTTWPFHRIWFTWWIVMISAAQKFCFTDTTVTSSFSSILSFQMVSFFFKSYNISTIDTK